MRGVSGREIDNEAGGKRGGLKIFYVSFKFCLTLGGRLWYSFAHLLAKVAQLVEPQIVDLVVAGSCPVFRPSLTSLLRQRGFLFLGDVFTSSGLRIGGASRGGVRSGVARRQRSG